jgi:hypothetical protein
MKKHYTLTQQKTNIPSGLKFRNANVGDQFKDVRVVLGSEELIFNETYMTGLVFNNRVVKFKKSELKFL